MSTEVIKTGQTSDLDKFKASVTNTEPEELGTGVVDDVGLSYFENGQAATVWSDNVDLNDMQLKLNRERVTNIHRAYLMSVTSERYPFKTLRMNTIAMRKVGWPTTPLKKGDKVTLFVWRSDKYVQWGFKK